MQGTFILPIFMESMNFNRQSTYFFVCSLLFLLKSFLVGIINFTYETLLDPKYTLTYITMRLRNKVQNV